MIEIRGLVKNFSTKCAVNGLDMTVRNGVAYGFLGRNGAGKTTTIRILMNVFRADSGEALIDGIPSYKEPKKIGYLPEERGMYSKRSVIDQLIYFGRLKGMSKAVAVKEANAKLAEMEAEEYADKMLNTLSKGNQQKIQLATALLGDPEIIILDEPFSGLDPINAQILKKAVRRQVDEGRTVIFSSHQMSQVEEFCDDICIINEGRAVIEGNLEQIKRSYPRDLIYVETENPAPAAFDRPLAEMLSAEQYVAQVTPDGAGYRVKLNDASCRNALLRRLDESGSQVTAFYVIEPSLEQIFVERVG